jgi:hypothetical protein
MPFWASSSASASDRNRPAKSTSLSNNRNVWIATQARTYTLPVFAIRFGRSETFTQTTIAGVIQTPLASTILWAGDAVHRIVGPISILSARYALI